MKHEMIQKLLCGALAASLVLGLAGCKPSGGSPAPSSSAPGSSAVSSQPASSDVPVLGVAETDYDGFEYLEKKVLTAEPDEEEKTEKQSLVVFIPQDEYASAENGRARSTRMGLSFSVDVDPLLQYKAEEYTLAENLDEYLNSMFDPEYTIYESVTVGKSTEDAATKSAKALVTFCYYDKYDNEMIPFYTTYYLKELDNGLTVLVSAEINGDESTGKLPGMLDEIEAFYGFRPEWDEDGAEKLADAAEAAGPKKTDSGSSSAAGIDDEPEPVKDTPAVKNADGTFTASGMTFSLPEGWEIDDGDEEQTSFAPDGDAAFAECAVMVTRQYSGASSADLEVFRSNPELLETLLKTYVTAEDETEGADFNFKMSEKSPFGTAIRLDFTQKEGKVNGYFIFDDEGYLYILMSADMGDDMEGNQALEKMFETAKQG